MKNNDHKQNGSNPDMPAKFVETTFRVRYAETDQNSRITCKLLTR